MTASPTRFCKVCGSAVDVTLLGGVCPQCLLREVVAGKSERFDGHELLGEIARGGMGVVYRARQREPERVVALKTLGGAALGSPEARARFRHEVEVMAALDHPAILPVHHGGEQDGIPFFTMKLVEGGTLAERLGSYAGKWRAIAALMIAVADAVQHAHARGVLHRDLKPGNILFDAAGQGYVSDFGIAKLADSPDADLTQTAAMIGTPHYLAPEVAAGGGRAASVASDGWSLGVILFELLTGEKPFQGETLTQILRALDTGDAPAPGRLRADVPRDLGVIVQKALNREPVRRYVSAQAFAEDLRAWLAGQPIAARAVPAHERAWLWTRRNPWLAGACTLLALASVAALAALAWGFQSARRETRAVQAARGGEREQLRGALLGQARAGRLARAMGWRDAGLQALREAAAIRLGEDVRDEAVAHLAGYDLRLAPPRFPALVHASPEFERYAAPIAGAGLAIRRLADDAELWRLPDLGALQNARVLFDPRGRWLAAQAGLGVVVFAEADRRELARWPGTLAAGVSDDGEFLFLDDGTHWRAVRTVDWTEAGRVTRQAGHAWQCAFSPQHGRALAASAWQREIELLDWRTGQVVHRVRPLGATGSFAWSGDDLVAGLSDGQVQVFDLRRERSVVLGRQAAPSTRFLGSRDGTLLLGSSLDGVTQLWHPASGENLVRARGLIVSQLCTDDRRFLTAGVDFTVGEILHPVGVRLVPDRLLRGSSHPGGSSFEFSPDGRLLVRRDLQRVAVHEVATGKLLAWRAMAGASFAAFTPDGRELWVVKSRAISVLRLVRQGARLALSLVREIPAPGDAELTSRILSADRTRLWVESRSKEIYEAPVSDFQAWQRWPGPTGIGLASLALSSDGRRMVGLPPGSALVREIAAPANVHLLDGATMPGRASFSPSGEWLIFSELNRRWHAHETRTWTRAHSSPALQQSAWTNYLSAAIAAEWSPSGAWFSVVCDGVDLEIVEAGSWRTVGRLHGPLEIPIVSTRIAADGATLAVLRSGGALEIWDLGKLAAELRALGIALDLPPPAAQPAAPAELAGPFEEAALPPLDFPAAVPRVAP